MPENLDADIQIAYDMAPEEAVTYLRKQGWAISDNWRDTLAAVRKRALVVTGVVKLDIIQKVRESLVSAREEGKNFSDFKKEVAPILSEAGWLPPVEKTNPDGSKQTVDLAPSRLKLIYRNNTQTALNAGRQRKAERASKRRPYFGVRFVRDRRQSDLCRKLSAELQGKVMRIDDPAARKYMGSLHHGCRNGIITYSEREVERMGLKVIGADALETLPDEGFDQSPAEPWEPDLSTYPDEDVEKFTEETGGGDDGG
jgi:uncharacterized protein with gpF-like domain